MRKVDTNLDDYKTDKNQDSNTSLIFPKEVRETHRRPADIRGIWDYLELLFSMLEDSYNGKYPVPKKTVIVGIFALLYLINPIDIIPDFIPLMGFADDLAALAFAASLIKDDLNKYRIWRNERDYV